MLTVGNLQLSTSKEANLSYVEQSQHYAMVSSRLYWKEDRDPIMRLCINKEEAVPYLENAHVALGNMHLSPKQTLKRDQRMGVYWPTMYKDVHKHIRECTCQTKKKIKHRGTQSLSIRCHQLHQSGQKPW